MRNKPVVSMGLDIFPEATLLTFPDPFGLGTVRGSTAMPWACAAAPPKPPVDQAWRTRAGGMDGSAMSTEWSKGVAARDVLDIPCFRGKMMENAFMVGIMCI